MRWPEVPNSTQLTPTPGQLLVLAQDLGQRPAGRREQELVQVDEGDPARVVAVALEAVVVGLQLARAKTGQSCSTTMPSST